MYKKIIGISLLLLVFGFHADAQKKCNLYSEPTIAISFCAPEKWKMEKGKSDRFASVWGTSPTGFHPNINLGAGDYRGPLSQSVDQTIKDVLATKGKFGITNVELISRTPFGQNNEGVRIVFDVSAGEIRSRTIQYFFNGLGDTKIIVTATMPFADIPYLEPIIEASLKTFKVADKTN